jgi:hypothetical protein
MASRLSDRLLAAGLVPLETVRAAIARQAVYGGALDTALLELEAIDEASLWNALSEATDLPVPDRALCESPEKYASPDGSALGDLGAAWWARNRAVPVGLEDGTLAVLCGEPIARDPIDAAAARLGIPFSLYVAPEIWLAAVQQAVFDLPMAPRLVRLFARVVGAQPVRRWQASYSPAPRPEASAAIERLLPAGRRPRPVAAVPAQTPVPPAAQTPVPPAAQTPVSPAAQTPVSPAAQTPVSPAAQTPAAPLAAPLPAQTPVAPLAAAGHPQPPAQAPAAPRFDTADVPALIERLDAPGDDPAAARQALVALTKQDLGPKARRWASWWRRHQDDDRMDWLFEGLSHKTAEIRAAAEEELRALTGEYFGYHFDLPRRDRQAARARWQSWWTETQSRVRKTPR